MALSRAALFEIPQKLRLEKVTASRPTLEIDVDRDRDVVAHQHTRIGSPLFFRPNLNVDNLPIFWDEDVIDVITRDLTTRATPIRELLPRLVSESNSMKGVECRREAEIVSQSTDQRGESAWAQCLGNIEVARYDTEIGRASCRERVCQYV